MTDRDILRIIDDGANHFIRVLGSAPHMTITDTGYYTRVQPEPGEQGISFICDIRLDGLPPQAQEAVINEIRAQHIPVWFSLMATDEQFRLFFGRERLHGAPPAEDDEVYMAMLPDELLSRHDMSRVQRTDTAEAFADCAKVANDVLAGGRADVHPVYHWPLCRQGAMQGYVLYHNGQPAAAAFTMENDGVVSLELVATRPELRRRGFAKAVCTRAVSEALAAGAKLVTVRAVNSSAARLYAGLGFRSCNHAM